MAIWMNGSFWWVQWLISNEFMNMINHSVIMVLINLSHPFQYVHYEGIIVNSDATFPLCLLDCEHSGCRNMLRLAGSLSGRSAPQRACRPLTAPQLLIFSLKPVLCLCPCLFCHAFQSTLLGSTSHINAMILFIYNLHEGKHLQVWMVTVIFAMWIFPVRVTLLTGRWLF